jgi:hypothetical protein
MSKALDLLIGGWTISGIATLQSGFPLIISRPAKRTGTDPQIDDRGPDRWFDTAAFAPAAPFTFGDVSRTQPDLRTDALRNIDLTLGKYISFPRGTRLQIRAEAFNLLNTTRFGAPDGNVTSASFGRVTVQANNPRQIQLGAKLYW